MGFFDWMRKALRRIRGVPEEPPSPEPLPEEEEYEDAYEEPQPIPPEEESEEPGECDIFYQQGRQEGKIQVFPRWRAINPDAECIKELFRRVTRKSSYAVIICGEPCSEYPGHEGETEICLTYKFAANYILQIVYGGDYQDALDFANIVNYEYGSLVECWETCVEIAVLDN